MRTEIYAVHDKAVGVFLPCFFTRSRGEALRSFMDAVNDPNHQFARHATDYSLHYIGSFDDDTGGIECGAPELVITALSCLKEAV